MVLPTGTGKTVTQLLTAERAHAANPSTPGRPAKPVLWIAHRKELLAQAARTFKAAGWQPFTEQAEKRATPHQVRVAATQYPTVVCASVATLQGKRLARWRPDDFAVVLVDEAHHGVAKTWKRLIAYWQCPVVGFTATPQRKGLAHGFTLAYSMALVEAIDEGWLVPVHGRVVMPEWDLSKLTKPSGEQDLNIRELSSIVDQNLGGAVAALRDLMQGRATLSFWPSVNSAQGCARMLAADGVASCWVSGETPDDERDQAVRAFRASRIQALANCAVLTEGFDAPVTRVLAMARPTRSEVLYYQMLGRGLRPLPGVIDGLETAEERRAAIAESAKPHAVVLDYHGTGAQFDLMSLVVALGGNRSKRARDRAHTVLASGEPVDVRKALDRAERDIEQERIEREERERRAAERARERAERMERQAAEYRARMADGPRYMSAAAPWLDMNTRARLERRSEVPGPQATEKQRKYLFRLLKEARADRRLIQEIWSASDKWSRSEISKEIVMWERRGGRKKTG